MKTIKLLSILVLVSGIAFLTSCSKKEGCTDPTAINYDSDAKKDNGSCEYEDDDPAPTPTQKHSITFNFTHNYNGTNVTAANFNTIQYTNAFGNQHSISRMRYLISDIRLYKANGDSVVLEGYNLVDLTNSTNLTYVAPENVAKGTYTGIAFTFGFDETDNIDGAYNDLNSANWNWPSGLGGGYHYMQFEGKYIDSNSDTTNFAYHQGTARDNSGSPTVYENNHFLASLSNSGFTLNNDATIEIKMDISEWFKNPYTWDLNVYDQMLMPNYQAQLYMNQNGRSVFSVGSITQ